ncbi:MAG: hypothetical protein QXY45_02745 [Candidatus Aenigmatarchaeota archaeon]
MKNILKIIYLTLGVVFLIFIIIFLSSKPSISDKEINQSLFEKSDNIFFEHEIIRYYTNITVIPIKENSSKLEIGISTDKDYIGFGSIYQSYSSRRYLEFINNKNKTYEIKLSSRGNISKFLEFEKVGFKISPGEYKKIKIEAIVPLETVPGIYTGEIDVIITIPKNKLSELFQELI